LFCYCCQRSACVSGIKPFILLIALLHYLSDKRESVCVQLILTVFNTVFVLLHQHLLRIFSFLLFLLQNSWKMYCNFLFSVLFKQNSVSIWKLVSYKIWKDPTPGDIMVRDDSECWHDTCIIRLCCVIFKVFLTEYAGPLVIYLLFYARPALIYGAEALMSERTWASQSVNCYPSICTHCCCLLCIISSMDLVCSVVNTLIWYRFLSLVIKPPTHSG